MSDCSRNTCRICLEAIHDNEFDVIGEITRQMMEGLLLQLTLNECDESVMCHECARKLQNALDFKTTCLDAENKILPCVKSEQSVKLELKQESVEKLADVSEDQKVCRFCMSVLESGRYTCLQEKKENVFMIDTVLKHIPELHLNVADDELVTCDTCLVSLQELVTFISTCVDAEGKIKENLNGTGFAIGSEASSSIINVTKMEGNYERSIGDVTVKAEIKLEDGMEVDSTEINIKCEEIQIKLDQVDCERNVPVPNSGNTAAITMYNCQMCSYKTKYEHYFKKHGIIHEEPSDVKMYKCEKCSYRAKLAGNLKKHMLIHQNPLEVQMYSCDRCAFKTKRKGTLIKHMRVHQDLSQLPVYRCETCSFESKHKHSLDRHVLIHQNPSEITVYKCDSCSYETKHRSHLNVHMVTHKNPSEITMFYCEMCTFETKRKKTLKKHWLTHQDVSEVTWYKCYTCLFETKRKDSLKKHVLTHQDQSEATLYKCGECPFETRHKISLRRHCLTHQDPSEVTAYKCDKCSYSTIRKCHLKIHMRVHLNSSEMKMHSCAVCSFETKHQCSFDRHLLRHL